MCFRCVSLGHSVRKIQSVSKVHAAVELWRASGDPSLCLLRPGNRLWEREEGTEDAEPEGQPASEPAARNSPVGASREGSWLCPRAPSWDLRCFAEPPARPGPELSGQLWERTPGARCWVVPFI